MSFKKYLIESAESKNYNWNQFRIPAEYLDDRNKTRYLDAIAKFEKGIQDKHIWNADFKDTYSYDFSRNYEKAFEAAQKMDGYYNREKFSEEELRQFWAADINYNLASHRKAMTGIQPFKAKLPNLFKVIAAAEGMQEMIKELKGYIEKGRKPNEATVAKKQAFQAVVERGAASKVAEILRQSVEGIRREYEKVFYERLRRGVDNLLSREAELRELAKKNRRSEDSWWNMSGNMSLILLMQKIVDFQDYGKETKLLPDWNGKIEKQAKDSVNEILEGFVAKNVRKLAPIVDKKPLKNIKIVKNQIVQGNLDNIMSFEFGDGAHFVVYSQTIYKYSKRGLLFTQYPTRFRDVYLSNGQRMAAPDEEKMNKEFK